MASAASSEFKLLHVPRWDTPYRVPELASWAAGGRRQASNHRTERSAGSARGFAPDDDEPPCVRSLARETGGRLGVSRDQLRPDGAEGGAEEDMPLSEVAARLRDDGDGAPQRVSVGRLRTREGEPAAPPPPGVCDVRVDRASDLGNPFPMGDDGRDESLREPVCDA